jgi:hypothetical protein
MQEHLCRTLAHFIAYLASHLKLPLSRKAEQALLTASPDSWRMMTRTPDEWHKRELEALSENSGLGEPHNLPDLFGEFESSPDTQGPLHEPELAQSSLPPLVDYFKMSNCESFPKSFCIPHSVQQDSPLYFNAMQAVENPDLGNGTMVEPSASINTPAMNITPASDQELWDTAKDPEHGKLSQEMNHSAADDFNFSEFLNAPSPEGLDLFGDEPDLTIPQKPLIPVSSK